VAGHSGTPLATKLGIRPDDVVALLHAPDGLALELPDGVTVKRRATGRADIVVDFVTRSTELKRRFDRLATMVRPHGGLWIAWPKRSSGVDADVTDDVVRGLALPRGLVDNKVCAVDTTWTGLRIVWRVQNR
jgi:hypothetical protein